MYFGEHTPIVGSPGQYIWEVDPHGQCRLFRLLLDARGVTGLKTPHNAGGCPFALPQDCGEVSIAHRLQKDLNSITEHYKYISLKYRNDLGYTVVTRWLNSSRSSPSRAKTVESVVLTKASCIACSNL